MCGESLVLENSSQSLQAIRIPERADASSERLSGYFFMNLEILRWR